MNDLAKVLKALRDKPGSLKEAVAILKRQAPTPDELEDSESETPGM